MFAFFVVVLFIVVVSCFTRFYFCCVRIKFA